MQEILIVNAHVMDEYGDTIGESLWCQDGRIVAVDPGKVPAGVERLDAQGGYVLPAFEDAHVHLLQYARQLSWLDLVEAKSREEALRLISREVQASGSEWVIGGGWDRNTWPDTSFPTRADLDAVTGEHPCAMFSKDLHALWVNTEALHRMNIAKDTPNPERGFIQRDENGEATGILLEGALNLLFPVLPVLSLAEAEYAIARAEKELFAVGIVGVHTNEGLEEYRVLEELYKQGKLRLRVTYNLPGDALPQLQKEGLRSGMGPDDLQIGGLKMFADGSLGSRTAAMLQPYAGSKSCESSANCGVELLTEDTLREKIKSGMDAGFYSVVHAIGDKANRNLLRALFSLAEESKKAGFQHRIEHAQLIDPADFAYIPDLPAVFSVQPLQAVSDIDMVEEYWGERGRWAYPLASIADEGGLLAFGSDAPVESPNPWDALAAAVTRAKPSSRCPRMHAEERLSRIEAIKGYTQGPAIACGLAGHRGKIAPGMDADLIILPANPYDSEADLQSLRPRYTLRRGKIVFK